MHNMKYKERNGFTLIEVLISIVIIVIGFFAALSMQLNSMKVNRFSSSLTSAMVLAASRIEEFESMDLSQINKISESNNQVVIERNIDQDSTEGRYNRVTKFVDIVSVANKNNVEGVRIVVQVFWGPSIEVSGVIVPKEPKQSVMYESVRLRHGSF